MLMLNEVIATLIDEKIPHDRQLARSSCEAEHSRDTDLMQLGRDNYPKHIRDPRLDEQISSGFRTVGYECGL